MATKGGELMAEIRYTEKTVYSTLKNRPNIEEQLYYAPTMDALDTLIDMDMLLEQAQLTDHQLAMFKEYFIEGYTMQEISDRYGYTSHNSVRMCINRAKNRIRKVLIKWGEMDE